MIGGIMNHKEAAAAAKSLQLCQLFVSGGQSIGVSASTSVLQMNIQDCFPLGWTGWISLQSKGLSRVFSNNTVQKHQFFGTQARHGSVVACWRVGGTECSTCPIPLRAWYVLKEVTIIFITSTIVQPQVNSREGTQLHPPTEKIGLKIYWAWPPHQNKTPLSVSPIRKLP